MSTWYFKQLTFIPNTLNFTCTSETQLFSDNYNEEFLIFYSAQHVACLEGVLQYCRSSKGSVDGCELQYSRSSRVREALHVMQNKIYFYGRRARKFDFLHCKTKTKIEKHQKAKITAFLPIVCFKTISKRI